MVTETAHTYIDVAPRQADFHDSVALYDETGYGGARGGGKSFAICHEALRQCIDYPGNVGAICRFRLAHLKDTTMAVMRSVLLPRYEKLGLQYKWTGGGVRPELEIVAAGQPTSRILWRQGKDEEELMSANLGFIGLDEAHQIPKRFYDNITASLGRCILPDGTRPPGKLFWGSNPGPGWCKQLFPVGKESKRCNYRIRDKRTGERFIVTRAYVPALPQDNPHLPPGYAAKLRATHSEKWCQRFLEGDWAAFEGQVFEEFDDEIHVIRRDERSGLFRAAPDWTHLLCLDWGYRNPTAAHVVSIDYQGRFYVWKEYRRAGLTPAEHAPAIKEMCEGIRVSAYIIDYAAVDQTGGINAREQFRNAGIDFINCIKRPNGEDGSIFFIKNLMTVRGDEPSFYVSEACPGLIGELENAMWEPQTAEQEVKANPKERMVNKDDHSIDAVCMAVEWYRHGPVEYGARDYRRGNVEWLREEIRVVERGNRLDTREPEERRRAVGSGWAL